MNGTRASPARRSVSSAPGRQLVGRAEVRAAAAPTAARSVDSSIIPSDAATGRSSSKSARLSTPGFRCGSSDVSSRTARGRGREILERRRVAERRELLARRLVAQLGLVAEREQRLAAAGALAGARHLDHLVDRQVGALPAPRRPRERAVVADVAAELRQRDEDLRAVGDEAAAPLGSHGARLGHQLVDRPPEQIHRRIVETRPAHIRDSSASTSATNGRVTLNTP